MTSLRPTLFTPLSTVQPSYLVNSTYIHTQSQTWQNLSLFSASTSSSTFTDHYSLPSITTVWPQSRLPTTTIMSSYDQLSKGDGPSTSGSNIPIYAGPSNVAPTLSVVAVSKTNPTAAETALSPSQAASRGSTPSPDVLAGVSAVIAVLVCAVMGSLFWLFQRYKRRKHKAEVRQCALATGALNVLTAPPLVGTRTKYSRACLCIRLLLPPTCNPSRL